MAKITLMVGISGSGKSTKAKEISEKTGALIVNRDKLREMLFGYTEQNIASYYIEAMFDDRNQVVDHARKLGFNVFQVNYGDF